MLDQLLTEAGLHRLDVGGHQVVCLIPIRRLALLDHLSHQLGERGRHLFKQLPEALLGVGKERGLLFNLSHPLLMKLVVILILAAVFGVA